jgi:protein-S-isoprenylcysteine O-methyltransferase Ste14
MADKPDTAGVIAFPPLIYAMPLIATLVADRLVLKRRLPPVCMAVSTGFFIGAIALIVRSVAEFKKAGTAIDPFEETTALVDTGPFAHTRNPLYLALTFTYAGIALAARSALPLAFLPVVLRVMSVGVIEREERYLQRKFGERYRDYRDRVPRWL